MGPPATAGVSWGCCWAFLWSGPAAAACRHAPAWLRSQSLPGCTALHRLPALPMPVSPTAPACLQSGCAQCLLRGDAPGSRHRRPGHRGWRARPSRHPGAAGAAAAAVRSRVWSALMPVSSVITASMFASGRQRWVERWSESSQEGEQREGSGHTRRSTRMCRRLSVQAFSAQKQFAQQSSSNEVLHIDQQRGAAGQHRPRPLADALGRARRPQHALHVAPDAPRLLDLGLLAGRIGRWAGGGKQWVVGT